MCNKKNAQASLIFVSIFNRGKKFDKFFQMSIFAEAAKKVARTCASQSSHSKNCEPTPTTTTTTTTVATAEEVVSEVVEKFTFMGYVKHFIASIEVWHLNVFSTVVVILFVYIQFRSMFIARPRPKQIQHESFNQKEAKQKEFADKQVKKYFFNFLRRIN